MAIRGRDSALAVLCAVLALLVTAPPIFAQSDAPTLINVAFGPEQIWNPDAQAHQALFACGGGTFTCVRDAMQANGASADAIAFYRLTSWFLIDLNDTGLVQVGSILTPWRANETVQSALLGGIPPVVYVESGLPPDAERSNTFMAIQAGHPNAMLWAPGPRLEGMATSPQGGQRFVFDYRVLDGCHACAVLGYVRVAFDFALDGTYRAGNTVLE